MCPGAGELITPRLGTTGCWDHHYEMSPNMSQNVQNIQPDPFLCSKKNKGLSLPCQMILSVCVVSNRVEPIPKYGKIWNTPSSGTRILELQAGLPTTWGRGWMTKASGVGERRKGRGELRRDCHHRVAALFVPTRMQQWYMIYDI